MQHIRTGSKSLPPLHPLHPSVCCVGRRQPSSVHWQRHRIREVAFECQNCALPPFAGRFRSLCLPRNAQSLRLPLDPVFPLDQKLCLMRKFEAGYPPKIDRSDLSPDRLDVPTGLSTDCPLFEIHVFPYSTRASR